MYVRKASMDWAQLATEVDRYATAAAPQQRPAALRD